MNKRERLEAYLTGEDMGGFVPAAFFLHFGEGFLLEPGAAARHEEFFEATDMDFAKIQFELEFPSFHINGASDFDQVPRLPLEFYDAQFQVVETLLRALKAQAHVVLTLYSPYMLLCRMAGAQAVAKYLEAEPEPVVKAEERIADSLLAFVRRCARAGLDGFYHSTQGGESRRFENKETFLRWVKPIDLRVMAEIDGLCPFNILHICDYHREFGQYDDLSPFLEYPGRVVNVSTDVGGRTLSPDDLSQLFGRPYMGGLDRLGPLSSGSAETARQAALDVVRDAPPRFILGADCTVPPSTSWENLRAAVDAAHGA